MEHDDTWAFLEFCLTHVSASRQFHNLTFLGQKSLEGDRCLSCGHPGSLTVTLVYAYFVVTKAITGHYFGQELRGPLPVSRRNSNENMGCSKQDGSLFDQSKSGKCSTAQTKFNFCRALRPRHPGRVTRRFNEV